MRKSISLIAIAILLFSCSESKIAEEIDLLQHQNDSLKMVLADINNKYVFDSIAFREIYHPDNTYELGSEFKMELVVVGYSQTYPYFVKYDSIINDRMVNPDTLKLINGGYKLQTILTNEENPIWIDMNIVNTYGKSKKGRLYDNVKIKD